MKILDAFRAKKATTEAFKDVYEQHVTDASFLWVLRSIGLNQPHYSCEDIADLERRIDANLDGLMNSLDIAWEICLEALSFEQPGEVFTAAVIAFRSRDVEKIKTVVSAGLSNESTIKGLTSAMGWLPGNLVHGWVQKFLGSKDLIHKYLAVAVCSIRRENPGDILTSLLQREDCISHKKLRARLLRFIGELKLHNFQWALDAAYDDDDPDVKFWVNWSTVLLGDYSAVDQLQDYVESHGPLQRLAIQTAFRVLPVETSRQWISRLAADPEQARAVIQATGVLGDPLPVPWLIEKMRKMETAKVAAEAFVMITGISLERYELAIDGPDEITVVPNDDPSDENVSLDEDENLPFPDVDKVAYTWQKHGGKYLAGHRYFMGAAITPQALQNKIKDGLQRQRQAAAIQLALLEPETLLVNTREKMLN